MEKLGQRDLRNPRWIRAGAIPYLYHNGELLFYFAIDRDYLTLTDFGGHRDSTDSDILQTIQREMLEETYGVFGFFPRDYLNNCLSLTGETNLEVLIPLDGDPHNITEQLNEALLEAHNRGEHLESIGAVWISADGLRSILSLPFEEGKKVLYYNVLEPLSSLFTPENR